MWLVFVRVYLDISVSSVLKLQGLIVFEKRKFLDQNMLHMSKKAAASRLIWVGRQTSGSLCLRGQTDG